MANIEFSPTLAQSVICLTKDEARLIEPIIRAAKKHEQALADKYQDIIDGGYATDRQTSLQAKHDEKAQSLRSLNATINFFLRK